MQKKNRITITLRSRLIITVVSVAAIALFIISYILMRNVRESVLGHTNEKVENSVRASTAYLDQYLGERVATIRQAGRITSSLTDLANEEREAQVLEYLRLLVIDNPEIISLNFYLENLSYEEEVYHYYYFNEGSGLLSEKSIVPKGEMDPGLPHFKVKVRGVDVVSDVFTTDVWGENMPTVSYALPLFFKGELIGTMSAEISLHDFYQYFTNEFIVSSNDQIVYHPEFRYNAETFEEVSIDEDLKETLKNIPVNTKDVSINLMGREVTVVQPVRVGKSTQYWRLITYVPFKEIYDRYGNLLNLLVVLFIIALVLIGFTIYFSINAIYKSLFLASGLAKELAEGKVDLDKFEEAHVDNVEVDNIILGLEGIAGELKKKSDFTVALSNDELDNEYEAAEFDTLGKALMDLRNNLRDNRQEAEKRQWTNEGLAQFSEVLRGNTTNFVDLSQDLISNLVKYLDANQGAIFLVEEDKDTEETYLNLTAAYAYERKKFLVKRMDLDEGLIGQAIQEKGTIHLTEVPENYIRITSGLGQAVPSVLLIVPLKVEGETNGAIEIAGFHPFKDYEVSFVEKLAESISMTIKSARNNESTRVLLEQSQIQAEELKSAEEEMRQNMEELQATQEELNRRAGETEALLKASERKSELSDLHIEISGMLTKVNAENDAFSLVLEEVCKSRKFDLGHVFTVVTEKGKKTIRSTDVFYSENEEKHKAMIESTRETVFSEEDDVIGMCYHEQYPLFWDALDEGEIFLRSDAALKSGFKNVYVFPIFSGNRISDVMEFYSSEEREMDDTLLQFGSQIGKSMGEVLTRIKLARSSMTKEEDMSKFQYDMKAVLDGMPYPVVCINEEGVIENSNKKFIAMTGMKPVQVKKTNFFDLLDDDIKSFEDEGDFKVKFKTVEKSIEVQCKFETVKKADGDKIVINLIP